MKDDSFYLIFNAYFEQIDFVLPPNQWGLHWLKILDTNEDWIENAADKPGLEAGSTLSVAPRSLVLLQRQA